MEDGGHSLAEIIDLPRLQRVCDGLSATARITLAVLDPDGAVVISSGWQDICTRFHRRDRTTAAACRESDLRISEHIAQDEETPQHIAYQCANSLWDVAFPLIVDGVHVGTVFTGQFLYDDDEVDVEAFRHRARQFGFDEGEYLDALARVPVVSHTQVEQTIGFLADLVGMLTDLGLNALRHEQDLAALTASEEQFRSLAEGMPVLVCTTDADGEITYINAAAARLSGRSAAELVGTSVSALMDDEAKALVTAAREQLTPEHPAETHEEPHPAADGTMRWYEWTNHGFFDGQGHLQRVQALGRDVTMRRAAEQALLDSEQRLRLAHVAANDVVWDWDAATDTRRWSLAGPFVFGWSIASDEALPGPWWEDRIHPDDRAHVIGSFAAGVDDPECSRWRTDYRFRRADGTYVEIEDRATIFRTDDGAATRVIGVMLDISERREAERRVAAWRDLMQYIIRHDPNAIAVFDTEMRYVFVSDRYLQDYRLGDRDVIGLSHYEVLPEIPDRWKEIHRRVLDGAVERAEEDPFPRADGRVDWVRWECRPWRTEDGSIGGLVLYSELITERREAAEELRRSQRQYETFINATSDMAFLKDEELRYVIVNRANAAFFGLDTADVVGKTDAELMEPAHAEACRESDLRALAAGDLVIATEEQGDRVYETRKFPVALADGATGIGGYARDVTEQRRAEEEVLRLASDLERRVDQRTAQLAATNRELESFAYSISHDLRAPLRALDGFSEILLQDYAEVLDDTARGYLGRIKGAATHMAGLMDGLLQLSRLNREELDVQQVDLSALATRVADELREGDPGRDVDVRIAPFVTADADPKLARLVLANLIGNSWKFTARHDHAVIEFGETPAPGDEGHTAFFVRDDGAGFDMRYAGSLFGAFQRLHTPDQFEGSGIGLATVQRIVHRHGGTVWAEGEVEKGATFWFTFAPANGG